MSEKAQLLLIDSLPVIIAAFFAGVLTIIMQLRHIKHLTNSALTIQTKRAEDAEAATKAGEILAKRLVDEELIRMKAALASVPQPAVIVASDAPTSVNPVTGDPSTPVHVTNVEDDPLHVVDAKKDKK